MPVSVDDLVSEALALKAEVETARADIAAATARIKTARERLKVLNPVIALYDGEPVEVDARLRKGTRSKSDENGTAPKRKTKASTKATRKRTPKPLQTTTAIRWPVYPEECLMPAHYHRPGQRTEHIGRGLCNAHVQRVRLGSMPEDEFAAYSEAAQEFAEANGFTLTDEQLRLNA